MYAMHFLMRKSIPGKQSRNTGSRYATINEVQDVVGRDDHDGLHAGHVPAVPVHGRVVRDEAAAGRHRHHSRVQPLQLQLPLYDHLQRGRHAGLKCHHR